VSSISLIAFPLGNCWNELSPGNKYIWQIQARKENDEHRRRYPEYRFRPVHNKNRKKKVLGPHQILEDDPNASTTATPVTSVSTAEVGGQQRSTTATDRTVHHLASVVHHHHHPEETAMAM
jgi:hypothetical protein